MIKREVSLLGVGEAIADSIRFMEDERPILAYKRMIRALSDVAVLLNMDFPDTESLRTDGSLVSVGGSNGKVISNALHGDYRWVGTVVEIKKGDKKGEHLFLVERAKGQAAGQRLWVIDKDVRLFKLKEPQGKEDVN